MTDKENVDQLPAGFHALLWTPSPGMDEKVRNAQGVIGQCEFTTDMVGLPERKRLPGKKLNPF